MTRGATLLEACTGMEDANMHPSVAPYYLTLIVAALIPTLAAMLGILFSNQSLARIETRMDARFTSLETKVDRLSESIHAATKQLAELHHKMDVRVTRLEERRS